MIIKYLFSDPGGDIQTGPTDIERPFLITPKKSHPFLTLGDYFHSIESFIFRDNGRYLLPILIERFNKDITLESINEVLIRTEKHGAFYHIASVEILSDGTSVKLCVSTALTKKGKQSLAHDLETISFLDQAFEFSYLPKVYFKGDIECHSVAGAETFSMLLAEWLEDYHEWHLSMDEKSKNQKIRIWDQKKGLRYASVDDSFEIFRQISKILTLYYNTGDFSQIYPWHNAAGDFIVKNRDGNIDVKLTTVRRYEPFKTSVTEDDISPMLAIVYFFLNMSLQIRLDKFDGVGDVAWADDFSVQAAIEGFFEALNIMESESRFYSGKVNEMLALLKMFDKKEIQKLIGSMTGLYQMEDPADLSVIEAHLKDHVNRLYETIQSFHL